MINMSCFNVTSGNAFLDLFRGVNCGSGGIFGVSILLVIYLVLFAATVGRYGVKTAFASAAYVGAIFAILLRLMGLINDYWLFMAIVLVVIGVMIVWFQRDE